MDERHLGFKGNTEGFGKRGLSADVPGLAEYLHPGAQVLDVGCGPGSVTLDVASAVAPGTAVGIDPMEDRIAMAAQLPSDRGVHNVTFEVGDAHALRFPDNTFDVVYSNLEYPGSEQTVPHLSMVPPLDAPQDPLWDVYRDIIAEGLIDQAALEEARAEMAAWYRHPHAFNMVGLILVAGRA